MSRCTVLGPVVVNGKEMVNTFYAQVKRFRKAPVIERSAPTYILIGMQNETQLIKAMANLM